MLLYTWLSTSGAFGSIDGSFKIRFASVKFVMLPVDFRKSRAVSAVKWYLTIAFKSFWYCSGANSATRMMEVSTECPF